MVETIFSSLELRFVLCSVFALIAGFFVGLEREIRGKDAGIGTHMLVVMGSMLFTFISNTVEISDFRIASQVVVGIGFLGGGLILKDGHVVRNLTTAASLWFVAGIGMAFGFELFFIGIFSTFIAVLAPLIPHFARCDTCEVKSTVDIH